MARAIGGQLGNYRIVALIGEGGMGEVFLGEHEVLGRRAAIKVLRSELSGNQDLVQRFFNEARETARLRSPAFVEIFDSGRLPDGSAYLVMELLRGENLGAHLQRVGRLPWPHALVVARGIAAAGGVAHGSGIIHRDLKPDNVFLSLAKSAGGGAGEDRVTVKLLDFGIAKVKGAGGAEGVARTRTGLILGTPLYMSPEQCRGTGAIDHRTDIYSSGCILHAMLSGNPPFPLEGFGEVIAAQLSTPPPLLRALGVDVPAALEALVQQMLAKAPDARPADMAAVVTAIDRVLAELPEKPTLQVLAVREAPLLPIAGAASGAGAGAVGAADATGVAAAGASAAPAVAAVSAGGTRLAAESPPDGDVGAGGTRLLQPSAGRSSGTLSSAAAETRSPASAPGRGRRWGAVLAVAAVGGAGALLLLAKGGPRHHDEERPVPVVPIVPAVDPKPAPPPPHPTPPAPPPAPAVRTSIQVRFTSDPAGATVVDGATDAVLGETPFEATFPRKAPGARMQLLVRRTGYRSRKVKLGLDEDGVVQVKLDKKGPAPAPVLGDDGRKL